MDTKKASKKTWVPLEFLLTGLVLITGGVMSLFDSRRTYQALLVILGILALASSLILLIRYLRLRKDKIWDAILSLTLAVVLLLIGILFFAMPSKAGEFLIYLIAFWFVSGSVFAMIASFSMRSAGRGLLWLILFLSLLLLASGLAIAFLPSLSRAILGPLAGLSLLINGLVFILLAIGQILADRKAKLAQTGQMNENQAPLNQPAADLPPDLP